MDDVVGDDNVSKLVAEKYELLYNSVKYKSDEFNKFVYDNTCDINNTGQQISTFFFLQGL